MKIAIGSDHRGFVHKQYIQKECTLIDWIDVGTYNITRTDYPIYAKKAIELLYNEQVKHAILLCGTGAGMVIMANRYKDIYAAIAWNTCVAGRIKAEDNTNVLVLPSDFISDKDAVEIINVWLVTQFKGEQYAQRIAMIDD